MSIKDQDNDQLMFAFYLDIADWLPCKNLAILSKKDSRISGYNTVFCENIWFKLLFFSLIKSRKTKSDGREKRKAIFEAKTKCAQKSRLLPPSGQNTSVVQTPFESCLKDAFLLNFLLKYHLKTHCQFSKKSYLYIVVMLPLCIPSRPHS